MSIVPPKTEPHKLEGKKLSLIKPHLVNLSGSGSQLDGLIIERDLEPASFEFGSASSKAAKHALVVHSGRPATMEWKIDGRQKAALFSEGDAIVNPAGLFVPHRWNAEVEILLLAIDPAFIQRIAQEMGHSAGIELIPRVQFRNIFAARCQVGPGQLLDLST
jgi:AraC family transcriptional regulator